MAWNRNSFGILFEWFIFSLLSFITILLLALNLTDISEINANKVSEINNYSTLYKSFIPLLCLSFLILLKV